MSSPTSHVLEFGHQRRLVLLFIALLLLFSIGDRLDRAIQFDALRSGARPSAFAAITPPPLLFPEGAGNAVTRRGLRRRLTDAATGDTGSATSPDTAPGQTGLIDAGGTTGDVGTGTPQISPGIAAVAAPPVFAADGQFSGTARSLFGIPTGVVGSTAGGGGGGGGTGNGGDGSPGAVPEPATWAYMIFGIGAVGAVMRRRRKLGAKARVGEAIAA